MSKILIAMQKENIISKVELKNVALTEIILLH
jgi:hypothetical protein